MTILSEYFSIHLHELRRRVLVAFCTVFAFSVLAYVFSEDVAHFFMNPLRQARPDIARLVYTNLTEAFVCYLKVSLLVGVILGFPVLCYQLWMFVAPGLLSHEKKVAVKVTFWGSLLFIAGALFAYFVVLPEALGFLMDTGGNAIEALPKLDSYLTFVARLSLAMGLAFEIPFLMVAAGKTGIVAKEKFIRQRMYYYIAILILSFLLAGGDVFSAVLVAFPLFGLYEAGILIMRIFN